MISLIAFIPTGNVYAIDSPSDNSSKRIITDTNEIQQYCTEKGIALKENGNLTSGQYATINAYPIYKGSYFKKTNIFTGSVKYGTAYRPIGSEYAVVYR